ncbi:MAG: hypothetical protein H7641_12015 [Candidatus Heimdallarchaeota archaeon]|nr:hypothetical protein [Candidatus Heimdallarchaeota archaeon]MCK4878285.1 hypothetical protein [Candidatus Heimdallarchaeota archaeon]
MAVDVHTLVVILVNIVFFYIAAAILSSIMFRREASKWSWINLIMAVICSLIWVFGFTFLVMGSAAIIVFGILFFLICWGLWVLLGGISERRSVYAATGTLLLWFLLSWGFMVIMNLFAITYFGGADFPTLFPWLI